MRVLLLISVFALVLFHFCPVRARLYKKNKKNNSKCVCVCGCVCVCVCACVWRVGGGWGEVEMHVVV